MSAPEVIYVFLGWRSLVGVKWVFGLNMLEPFTPGVEWVFVVLRGFSVLSQQVSPIQARLGKQLFCFLRGLFICRCGCFVKFNDNVYVATLLW